MKHGFSKFSTSWGPDLRLHSGTVKVSDICRKHGISDATFYNWKSKYAGMAISDLKRLKELKAENARLRKLVSNLFFNLSNARRNTESFQQEYNTRRPHEAPDYMTPCEVRR